MREFSTIGSGSGVRPTIWQPTDSAPGLTTDLQQEASRRLQVIGAVAMVVWVIYYILGNWVIPHATDAPPHMKDPAAHILCIAGFFLSLGIYLLARSPKVAPRRLLDLGLVYMIGMAAILATFNTLHLNWTDKDRLDGVSWNCIWVVLYPMVVPNSPRKILVSALVAASFDPLLLFLYRWVAQGVVLPAANVLFWIDNYICALLAVVPAHILQQMSRKVQRARELGSYRLEKRLGQGGMGEVWTARHNMLARPAAVKIIRADALGANDSRAARATLRRFEREAQATAALQSPHTIEVFDFGLGRDGTFYYVMELLQGFDLDTLVRRFGPLGSERVVHLLLQVCHSLDDAHASGLIHRDVKPANIFTCRKGQDYDFVKVLDFGLVKSERGEVDQASLATLQGVTTGTPSFMAPEQATSDTDLDHRADLYSLGCVAYWLLTGKLVFEARTAVQMLLRHVQDAPVPPSQRSELPISTELESVVLACLEKKPRARPQSACELAAQLRACGLEPAWDSERARDWWATHAPEIAAPAAPGRPVGAPS